MFSTRKYCIFKHLLFSILLISMTFMFSPTYAATTLHISTPDGVIATSSIKTYKNMGSIPVSATVLENNAILFSSQNASPENWSAEFIAPGDTQLEVRNYEDARRPDVAPDNIKPPTKPGINITIGSTFRQCTATVSGRFDVLEVSYKPDGTLKTLAIDFVQYCGTDTTTKQNPLRGSIRHNSNLALETLVPIAIAGADQQVVENNIVDLAASPITKNGNVINLNASNSSAGKNATIISYQWTQISHSVIQFIDSGNNTSTIVNPSFNIPPDVKLGGEEIVIELSITNSSGLIDSNQISIFVASKSDPQTSFFFQSDQADFVGKGKSLYVDSDDAIFSADNANNEHAHVTIDAGIFWFTNFGAVSGAGGLIANKYLNVVRHPSALGLSPGLSIHNVNTQCANVTGDFTVTQNKRTVNNRIGNLLISFNQICNQNTNPAPRLSGFIKYNYIDVSVPTADAGSAQRVEEAAQVTLDASNSKDSDPKFPLALAPYEWSQTSGSPVTLSNNTISNPKFIAPNLSGSTNEDLRFKVIITDNEGFKAEDSVIITVIPKVIPPTPKTGSPTDGGGGGCSINPNSKFDGSFYLMLLIMMLIQIYQKKIKRL